MVTRMMPSKAKITIRKSRVGAAQDKYKEAQTKLVQARTNMSNRYGENEIFRPIPNEASRAAKEFRAAKKDLTSEINMAKDYYNKRKSSQH